MKLTVSVLAYHLQQQYVDLGMVTVNDELRSFDRIRYFESSVDVDDIIWLGRWQDIKNREVLPPCLVCIGGDEVSQRLFQANMIDAIVLPNDTNIPMLYQAICDILFHYNDYEREIISAIIADTNLNSILNIVSRLFDNPVFVMDSALRVLGHGSIEGDIDKEGFWEETLEKGISSQKVMAIMEEKGLVDKLNTTKHALYVNQPPVAPFFSANFIKGDERLASLTVSCNKNKIDERLTPVVDNVVELLAPIVYKIGDSYYLQSSNLLKMILHMLRGAILDRQVLQYNLSIIQWNISDEYQIFKVELDPQNIDNGIACYTQELSKKIFPDSIIVDLQDAFILVLHRTGHKNLDEILSTKFQALMTSLKCKAGISMHFNDFSLIEVEYRLAGVALEKGKLLTGNKVLFHYEDYFTAHMIELCALSIDIISLCHPEAVQLYQYDKKHNSDFLDSLYMYIIEERRLASAAKRLYIHRNTLVYRLTRIQELFNIDIEDSRFRIHLIWSYQVLRHLHLNDRDSQSQFIWMGYE